MRLRYRQVNPGKYFKQMRNVFIMSCSPDLADVRGECESVGAGGGVVEGGWVVRALQGRTVVRG